MAKNATEIIADVVVVGGGAAGLAAAVSTAERGHDVVLIEKNGFLGGMATAANVGTICGLFLRDDSNNFDFICDGFIRTFAEQLIKKSNANPVRGRDGLKFLPYERFDFMRLCDEMTGNAGVNVLFHTTMFDINVEEGFVQEIKVITGSDVISLRAKYFIDATGFALLGNLISDITLLQDEKYQAGAFVFGLDGIKKTTPHQLNLHVIKAMALAREDGSLKKDDSLLTIVPGSVKKGRASFKLSIPRALHDDIKSVSMAELYSREKVGKLYAILKQYADIFDQSKISYVAPAIGIRTGPRYEGDFVLSKEDVLQCRKFDDEIARATWPIEFWEVGKKVKMEYFNKGSYYSIPLRSARNNKVSNLYFPGRHISANDQAIASCRVIGTCMQMGENIGKIISKKLSEHN